MSNSRQIAFSRSLMR